MSDNKSLARQFTPVGTMGQSNQLFTVYEKNWKCAHCSQENYASRPNCARCRKKKPALGTTNYVMDPALEALQLGKQMEWQEVVDPSSSQIYYYNSVTGLTQWDRPAEMGAAPLATGWFGRGKAGSVASQMYAEMNNTYLARPARKQKDFIDPKLYHTEGNNEYNIWYGSFLGVERDKGRDREPAPDRCKVATDAGFTKADQTAGTGTAKNRKYFCIHFAHGMCAKADECIFYHRIPLPEDNARCDELFDCFGRQRHSKHRDDMDGTGTFSKPCRTLFVGNLDKSKYKSPKALEDALWRHFGEWGELESLNVIHRLNIAFPRYRVRNSAEFAKEAMSCQPLDHGEILSIRWAHDDPNPVAQDSIERADKDALVAMLQSKGVSLQPAQFDYPMGYELPEAKRLKTAAAAASGDAEGSVEAAEAAAAAVELLTAHPELAYPNTDSQYIASGHDNNNNSTCNSSSSSSSRGPQQQNQEEEHRKAQQAALARLGVFSFGDDDGEKEQNDHDHDEGSRDKDKDKHSRYHPEKKEVGKEEKERMDDNNNDNDSGGGDSNEDEDEDDEEDEIDGWSKQIDSGTGAVYYFNSLTGDSSWDIPPCVAAALVATTTVSASGKAQGGTVKRKGVQRAD